MVTKKSWDEFRNSGFLWLVNTTLHMFGWSICVELDKDTGEITDCYPARVKFRGFGEKQIVEGYQKVSQFMMENAKDLYKESCE